MSEEVRRLKSTQDEDDLAIKADKIRCVHRLSRAVLRGAVTLLSITHCLSVTREQFAREDKEKADDAKTDAPGGASGDESDGNSSFGSTHSALEERVKSRSTQSVYTRLVGEDVARPQDQLKIGSFVLCSLGKSGHMIMQITEIDWSLNTVSGIYFEEQRVTQQHQIAPQFRKRDDRVPTELDVCDVTQILHPPCERVMGRRKRYIFQGQFV